MFGKVATVLLLAGSALAATPVATVAAAPSPTQAGLTANCNAFYQVVSGDTCQGIINKEGGKIPLTSFYSWNPAVGSTCNNLQIGYYVCVGVKAATSTSTSKTTSVTIPSPTPTGIVKNCNKFYKVVSGDTCSSIATKFGLASYQTFESWNLAINSGCTNLIVGDYYCVGVSTASSTTSKSTSTTTKSSTTSKPTSTTTKSSTTTHSPSTVSGVSTPSPTATGIVANCNQFYAAVSGDTCTTIADRFSTTYQNIEAWNGAISSACSNLVVGLYYCVGIGSAPTPPDPRQSPQAANCNKWYYVVAGDDCPVVEQKNGISDANFRSWNAFINSGCTNLWASYYACVGVSA